MWWFLYILIDAVINWYWIEKRGARPDYLPLFLVRGIAAIIYGGAVLHIEYNLKDALHWLGNVLLPFPFLFNLLLNKFRGKPTIYLGAESGIIDRILVKFKGETMEKVWFYFTLILFLWCIFCFT